MAIKKRTKHIKLRVFTIENPDITNQNNNLREELLQRLKDTTLKERGMLLNTEDPNKETDLIAYYDEYKKYLFGAVIRTKLASETTQVPDTLMGQNKITLSKLKSLTPGSHILIRSYFFAMSKNYLVSNIPGSCNITSFEVYLKWLLGRMEDSSIAILPKITTVEIDDINDIKGLHFKDSASESKQEKENKESIKVKSYKDISYEAAKFILNKLTGEKDNLCLDEIMEKNSLVVDFFLKFVPKTKEEDSQIKVAQILKTLHSTDGISIETKKGTIPLGDVEYKVDIDVELINNNFISEKELEVKMIDLLNELEKNDI